ncbi:hypothetical protein AGOR_G00169670 [Albula goreensis]|uniref:Uncharacterized protein n=1 Tax=Albula goreensis TaxID=1534307 RepID=A0A8T3CXN7_9TELE|nr:hypothetical protein AGOR_G00169670 [Albula goreensis]
MRFYYDIDGTAAQPAFPWETRGEWEECEDAVDYRHARSGVDNQGYSWSTPSFEPLTGGFRFRTGRSVLFAAMACSSGSVFDLLIPEMTV